MTAHEKGGATDIGAPLPHTWPCYTSHLLLNVLADRSVSLGAVERVSFGLMMRQRRLALVSLTCDIVMLVIPMPLDQRLVAIRKRVSVLAVHTLVLAVLTPVPVRLVVAVL